MHARPRSRWNRYGYLLFLAPALLPLWAYQLGERAGHRELFAWWPPVVVFGIIPFVDLLIGEDRSNPREEDLRALGRAPFYRILTWLAVPVVAAMLVFCAWVYAHGGLPWYGRVGWLVSSGIVGGAVGIVVAHELVHKDARAETWAGGLLLSLVCYGGFKVEHVRGHHVWVSTPADASSARYGQSVYRFLLRAYWENPRNAWILEARRLQRQGFRALSWRNELLWWYGLSLLWAAALAWWLGGAGVAFFFGASFCAITLLEMVNYVEHYGLERRLLANGRYEKTTPRHSWNSNARLTNWFLFQLQRHSDHHANAKRRYQALLQYEESPQLPAGYAAMLPLALLPPLWFRVMNPRVRAQTGCDSTQ